MMETTEKIKIFKGRGRIATEILGRSKYSNYDQALNEAVANALDARAKNISINLNENSIEIKDDGVGMTKDVLLNRYLTLGEKNMDLQARGQFGIGVCANAALGNILIVETRKKGEQIGFKIKIDFNKLEEVNIGEYEPEYFSENIDFSGKDYSTLIRIEKLRWCDIKKDDFIKYLSEKHLPLLLDDDLNLKIWVNGDRFKAEEPESTEKYSFDSLKEFCLGNKKVPILSKLSCGRIQGTFYLREETWEEPSIDIYVKDQRIDGYSGDKVDWLRIKDLSSAEGFRRRIKGIIKVQAIEKNNYAEQLKGGLILKSDRTAFFENSAYHQLCAYLNGTIKNKYIDKLPFGGVLRLINDEWYRNRGVDIKRTKTLVDKVKKEVISDLKEILKNEKVEPKISKSGEIEGLIRKEKNNEHALVSSTNLMFKCPKCTSILRVKKNVFVRWKKTSKEEKNKIQEEYWKCNACGYVLDPIDDKYKRGPIKGTRIAKIEIEEGVITDILVDALGKDGPRAIYNPDEGVIKINAQHSLLIYSLKNSDESFRCNLLDSVLYSIAVRKSEDKKVDFQKIYNDICSNVSRVVDVEEYEKVLNKFSLDNKK
jgi:hypothetical protein